MRFYELVGDYESMRREAKSSRTKLIPAHSHIMQAWLWHGMFGAVFWAYALLIVIKFIFRALGYSGELLAYLASISLASAWALLFSPFGNRLVLGAHLAVMCIMLDRIRKISTGQISAQTYSQPAHKLSERLRHLKVMWRQGQCELICQTARKTSN